MEWPLAPTSEPAQEPLTLDEAKQHCAIAQVDDNALVLAYLTAARQAAETALQRGLFTQTRVVQCSNFAETVWLPCSTLTFPVLGSGPPMLGAWTVIVLAPLTV